MRSLAVVVPRTLGEEVRRTLADRDLLRGDLKIGADGARIAFPVRTPPDPPIPGSVIEEREFSVRPASRPRSYRDLVDLPGPVAALLPRAFDVVGDIVLIRLPAPLEAYGEVIGRALLEFVPGVRLVGADLGVSGIERTRTLRRLAGEGSWRTRHSENGLTLDVDLERAYFSPRLAREHARVAAEIGTGDHVLDLCCGVGPFSLTIARDGRAGRIRAVDLNPVAIDLARSNADRLGVAGRIEFIEAPVERFLPTADRSDRVIFNLPREGIKYLPQVATAVEPEGSLYYYEVSDLEGLSRRPEQLAERLGSASGRWSVSDVHRVHPYSPTQELVAYRLRRDA